jgi:hypothetical protein
MQLSQLLSQDGIARYYAFAREYRALLEDIPGVSNATWFSNEARFHFGGYINRQNVRFWASESPRITVANPLQPGRQSYCMISIAEVRNVRSWVRGWCSHF